MAELFRLVEYYNLPRYITFPITFPHQIFGVRPLELIDGYCCDWSLVTWDLVLQALSRWVLRLASDVLICGGFLGEWR
jgi:hypothetical protein